MLHVLTIDDSPVFLDVFNDLLERFPDVRVVASARNGEEGLAAAGEYQPHLAFVDIHMPGLNGLEVTERLRQRHPSIRVVVTSLMDDESCQHSAASAGAERFVSKRNLFHQLPEILQSRQECTC